MALNTQKTNMKRNLTFPNFEDLKVSTRTFTVKTNLNIDLEKLFGFLEITEYIVVPKKRGRRKKGEPYNPNKHIKDGSVITLKYTNKLRGIEITPKEIKPENGKTSYFRNSITIVIVFDKIINFKVFKDGTFQMTGCKHHKHAELCVKYIWDSIKNNPELYSLREGTNTAEGLIVPSMRNIDFSLGFAVDREKLTNYMYKQETACIIEPTCNYTGINIKFPLEHDMMNMKIKKMVFDRNIDSNCEYSETTYDEYLQLLKPKDQKSKLKKKRYNTFLVFQSGKVIMSGIMAEFMKNKYYDFIKRMTKAYPEIEEHLDSID